MKVSFLLHLYQPPTQLVSNFNAIYTSAYLPLLKLIKKRKNFKLTLNTPLSFLAQIETQWVLDLKEIAHRGRVELTGSGAYHPLLTKLPQFYVEQQIILNEYALGYYYGKREDLEGSPSMLIKNVVGFFPPEMALNRKLISVLSDLGYNWVIADESAFAGINHSKGTHLYNLDSLQTNVITRNREISNAISFKKTLNIDNIINMILSSPDPVLISLDGEFFGHHYKEGIEFLEIMLDVLLKLGVDLCTVSDMVKTLPITDISDIKESSWGATDLEIIEGDIYPFWCSKNNKIQTLQWQILNETLENIKVKNIAFEDGENLPIWLAESMGNLSSESIKDINKVILLNKCVHSDQFWWSSRKTLPLGNFLYDRQMIIRSLDQYRQLAALYGEDKHIVIVDDLISKITYLLDTYISVNKIESIA